MQMAGKIKEKKVQQFNKKGLKLIFFSNLLGSSLLKSEIGVWNFTNCTYCKGLIEKWKLKFTGNNSRTGEKPFDMVLLNWSRIVILKFR